MKVSLDELKAKLPLPATDSWPEGVWDIEALKSGTMSVILYAPQGKDYQSSHSQDELYIIISGEGELTIESEILSFKPGDVLFVAANKQHHFSKFTDDFVTWAIFWGPKGGEDASQ